MFRSIISKNAKFSEFAAVIFGLLAVLNNAECKAVTQKPKLSKHPILLVVSFDGFRFDYLDLNRTPNLRSLQQEGVFVPYMEAQFPTKTFPNHQSMATGLYPDTHGITDNSLFDPLLNRNVSGYDDDPEFWNYHPDVLPFWIRNEQAGDERYSGCYMWAGSSIAYGENGSLRPTHYIPEYDGNVPWESRVETVISWITHDTYPANIVFLYHDEPDSTGHNNGTDDPLTHTEIERVDNRTGYLIQQLQSAGIYDDINLLIVSDHGMHTVREENIINTTVMYDPSAFMRKGGSPVYFLMPYNELDTESIYQAFKNASANANFSTYMKEELEDLHLNTNRRALDIVLIADPGYGFEDLAWRMNEHGIHGVHGYDNRAQTMRTILIARGPLFKTGYNKSEPVRNIDLFPLFSNIMGVPEAPHNGSLENIQDILATTFETKI